MEQKCLFCAILNKQIPAKIVYEDENSISILDIAPRSKGMTLVIPKKHYKEFSDNMQLSAKVFSSALIVGEMIKLALHPKDIEFSVIPTDLNHFHVRVYPIYENEFPLVEIQPKQITEKELDEIVEKMRAVRVLKKEEIVGDIKKEEKKRSEEDIYWINREMSLT